MQLSDTQLTTPDSNMSPRSMRLAWRDRTTTALTTLPSLTRTKAFDQKSQGKVLLKASDWGRRTGYSRLRRGYFYRNMLRGVQGPLYFRRVVPLTSLLLLSLREY